ncbi:hypothetical protein DPM19_03830 [Actinomadura craniellae]|uniref:Uncharacterized protein n=1 Tax=Actinomadura craniellae TaxID=2231787 RepID=A0A365HCT1_9ACTN|nr:hypothetical protein [Actinomadura craniellae]RAY16073.1 hypothetical protein DPM19_03830 [Actinomadura craniellae]
MKQQALNTAVAGILGAVFVGGVAAGAATKVANAANEEPTGNRAAAQSQELALARDSERPVWKIQKRQGAAAPEMRSRALASGTTKASYFWDDGSGVRGDTGAPAGGKPMQKGLFASPSWPLHSKVRVTYQGRSVTGFVGDRGPGEPSHRGVMLDLDTYTFRYLYDGGKPSSNYDAGVGAGHLNDVKYEVLSWGSGAGEKGAPQPFKG